MMPRTTRLAPILLCLALSGCITAGSSAPTMAAQQQALSDIAKFSDVADQSLTGLKAALSVEIELRKAFPTRISADEHALFLRYVERVNDGIDAALVEAKSEVSQPVTRRDVVKRLLQLARAKLEDGAIPISDPTLRVTISAALSAVLLTLQVVAS